MERRPVPSFIQKRKLGQDDKEILNVEPSTLTSFWRSKEDIYKYLTE
jgi:hypothetical protein